MTPAKLPWALGGGLMGAGCAQPSNHSPIRRDGKPEQLRGQHGRKGSGQTPDDNQRCNSITKDGPERSRGHHWGWGRGRLAARRRMSRKGRSAHTTLHKSSQPWTTPLWRAQHTHIAPAMLVSQGCTRDLTKMMALTMRRSTSLEAPKQVCFIRGQSAALLSQATQLLRRLWGAFA
jgi:hypothetical protein